MSIPTAAVFDSTVSLPVLSAPRRARWPVSVLGVPLDPVTTDEALARIAAMVASRRPHYVVTPNVDFLVQARRDSELHRILCEADLVLCDGQPIVWASRWLGNPLPERVAGADLAPRLMAQAARLGHRVFLLGATEDANARAAARLVAQHPGLAVAGHYSPPFRPLAEMDNADIAARIRAAQPDILLVGFGCPKQEKWIVQNYRTLGVPVCLGLGATIDFLAGRVSRAPTWMRRTGLEWTYRLMLEPRRLFRRYWTDARCFAFELLAQCWSLRWNAPKAGAGEVAVIAAGSWNHVRASGILDRAAIERAADLCGRIGELDGDCRVDLANVQFVDSTGLAALSLWRRKLLRRGRRFVLWRPSGPVRRLLEQAGLTRFATIESHDQLQAA